MDFKRLKTIDKRVSELLYCRSISSVIKDFNPKVDTIRYLCLASSMGVLGYVIYNAESMELNSELVLYFSSMVAGLIGYDRSKITRRGEFNNQI